MKKISTELADRLLDEKVPLCQWGADATKKIDRLAGEIESGCACIGRDHQGRVTCTFRLAEIYITHRGQILVRDKIILDATTSRPLTDIIGSTLSVPIGRGESSIVVAASALQRFFSLPGEYTLNIAAFANETSEPMVTGVYPGLQVVHVAYPFDWDIPRGYYDASGYVREESVGAIHYQWLTVEA